MLVTAEINCPENRVPIACHNAFHRINKTSFLAKLKIKARVHTWTSKDIVGKVKRNTPFLKFLSEGRANHHMSLMSLLLIVISSLT